MGSKLKKRVAKARMAKAKMAKTRARERTKAKERERKVRHHLNRKQSTLAPLLLVLGIRKRLTILIPIELCQYVKTCCLSFFQMHHRYDISFCRFILLLSVDR